MEEKDDMWNTESQRASHHWGPPGVCTVFAKLDRTLGLAGLHTGKASLSLALPLSAGQGPPGPALLCRRKIANPGLLWLNTERRSFIKELICYSLPLTHSFSFSHTLPFSTGSLCHTPTSFLHFLSSSLILCSPLPFLLISSLGDPTVSRDIMWLPLFSHCCVWNHWWLLCPYGK